MFRLALAPPVGGYRDGGDKERQKGSKKKHDGERRPDAAPRGEGP